MAATPWLAERKAASREELTAVTVRTRPPLDTTPPSFRAVPAWKTCSPMSSTWERPKGREREQMCFIHYSMTSSVFRHHLTRLTFLKSSYTLTFSSHRLCCCSVVQTCDLYSFLVGAGVTGAGHDNGDSRAVLLPHGGVGSQCAFHGVRYHFVQVALQQGQQHLHKIKTHELTVRYNVSRASIMGQGRLVPDTQDLRTDSCTPAPSGPAWSTSAPRTAHLEQTSKMEDVCHSSETINSRLQRQQHMEGTEHSPT